MQVARFVGQACRKGSRHIMGVHNDDMPSELILAVFEVQGYAATKQTSKCSTLGGTA